MSGLRSVPRPPTRPAVLSALGALYDRHGSLAYGLALRLTGDRARAEEAVCAAFVSLSRSVMVGGDRDTDRRRVVAAVVTEAMRSVRPSRTPSLSTALEVGPGA